jgi:hypothetical protein
VGGKVGGPQQERVAPPAPDVEDAVGWGETDGLERVG